jgi:hypothetical protein
MTHSSAGAHFSREVRSGDIGHVTASEPTSAERQGPEQYDTWQRRSPLNLEARSGAAVHMAAPEPTSAERQGLKE